MILDGTLKNNPAANTITLHHSGTTEKIMFIKSQPPTLRISYPLEEVGHGILEATLTNAPQNTLWRRLMSYLGFLIRFTFAAVALSAIYLVFVTRTRILFSGSPGSPPPFLAYLFALLQNTDGQSVVSLATTTIYLSVAGFRGYTKEKLLVVRRTGMMVVTSKTIRWSGRMVRTETWISLNSDGQFWIHEFGDRCVLAVVVDNNIFGQEDLVVVFPVGYSIF